MMKRLTIWGGLTALLIFQACENKIPETTTTESPVNEVTFTSTIDDASASRAYDSQWEAGDKIGVYMAASGTNEPQGENIPYNTEQNDGFFIAENDSGALAFPEDGTEVDFTAYYPYDADVTTSYPKYAIDVTDQSRQSAIDLMIANNLTKRSIENLKTGNVLQFRHVLSKLVINISPAQKGIRLTVLDVPATATVNLETEAITPMQETADIPMYVNEEGTQAEAILIPQDNLSGGLRIKVELDGKSKDVPTNITILKGGNKYVYNFTITGAGSNVTVDPQAKYSSWMETPVITESELAKSNIKYITHYTDETYGNTSWGKIRNYSMLYDTDLKMAYWVAYPLHSHFIGDSKRKDNWKFDPEIDKQYQINVIDKTYSGSIYRRGHQIPSNDRTASQYMNEQTFYVTNQTPQRQDRFNGYIWMQLEQKIHGWASGSDTIYIVTGAVPPKGESMDKIYDNSGNQVVIPDYYYKAVARKISGQYHTIGFWMEHKDYENQEFMNYACPVSELEEKTGFTFFPDLSSATKNELKMTYWQ